MTTDETILVIDIDGCLCRYGVFLPTVRFFEEVSNAKSKLLKHSGCTSDCLAVGTQGWVQSALSLPRALRADPTIRHYGRSVHRLAMEHVLQCKLNPELIEAFDTLLNAPNVKIVFFTNGQGGHARNVVKMVLGEDLANKIPIILTRTLDNGRYRKPEEGAYLALKNWMKTQGKMSKFFFIDDSAKNLEGAQAVFESLNISVQCLRIGRSNPNDAFPSYGTLVQALGSINTNRAVCALQQASR